MQDVIIKQISEGKIAASTQAILDIKGKMLSPGWVDMNTNVTETGSQWDETIDSLLMAACAGGFTEIVLMPNTNPIIDTANALCTLKNYAYEKNNIVDVHFVGALTKGLNGKELAELYDMSKNGAIAFSNGVNWLNDSNLMLQALKYTKMLNNGLIISIPQDPKLTNEPIVNESINTLKLGLKGTAYISESIAIKRDLELTKYTSSKIHFSCLSTKEAIDIIKEAKTHKLNITADTTSHHIYLDDSCLKTFDTNYKVNPPLRSYLDMYALREGLKTNIINTIVSQHIPSRQEDKMVEFTKASYGINGIESSFSCINTSLSESMNISDIIEKITYEPRKILNLQKTIISEGYKAKITIFDVEKKYTLHDADFKSHARNNPFTNQGLNGKARAVINNNQIIISDNDYNMK
ncbi:MAG: dihydroorotase [Solitalea-like symbiont of Acarus siro]